MAFGDIERNKLDCMLTDMLPEELSGLFSYSKFYEFLLKPSNIKTIEKIRNNIMLSKMKNDGRILDKGWSSMPLKYTILKGTDSTREISIIQPLSILNVYFFLEIYQKDILYFLEKHHVFSIRYHRKSKNLYYKGSSKKVINYFYNPMKRIGVGCIETSGNFYDIVPFRSINSFSESRIWRMCNLKFKYCGKIDYKSCFNSIYTHTYTWLIERNVCDAKNAKNDNFFVKIDRTMMNINGLTSNGIVVGPEFSRMIAEVLLQQIDTEVYERLGKRGMKKSEDYCIFRYVDDIFIFSNTEENIDGIIEEFRTVSSKYHLNLNDLKSSKDKTPFLPKEWLPRTRQLADEITEIFNQGIDVPNTCIISDKYISVDRWKSEFTELVGNHRDGTRTISAYILSVLLNNISKKKNGYKIFNNEKIGKSYLIIDFSLFVYSFCPTFEQTRKIISIISFFNDEVEYKNDVHNREKLRTVILRYNFVFQNGQLSDLCDWFPFLSEYGIALDIKTEDIIVQKIFDMDNPILLANLLIYAQYNVNLRNNIKGQIEKRIISKISNIDLNDNAMLYLEMWYVFIFHNCPFLSTDTLVRMENFISSLKKNGDYSTSTCINLITEFMNTKSSNGHKPKKSFFDWNGNSNFGKSVTYSTYRRTLFKNYHKGKNWIFASL